MLNVANKPLMLSVINLNAVILCGIKRNAVMLSVIKLNAVMLSAIMLNVVAPNVLTPQNLLFTFNKMKKVFIGILKQIRGISQLISALSKFSRFSKKVFCSFLSKMG
jgi:hypothetical protein